MEFVLPRRQPGGLAGYSARSGEFIPSGLSALAVRTGCDGKVSRDDDLKRAAAIRRSLAERIGPDQVELWFGNGASLRVHDGALEVTASTPFRVERQRKFHGDLAAACLALGLSGEVRFQVDSTLTSAEERPDTGSSATRGGVSDANPPAARTRRPLRSLRSFVVGDTNRLAYTAAEATPRRLGSLSPLFFFGPSGCGKSHLLEGIAAGVRRHRTRRRCVNLSAEQFTSHFLESLQGSGLPSFRRKYRGVDLLIIDDVHFFAGKRATLVELQHTIDTLLRDGRQLVLAADRPPAELTELGPELTARMAGGLVCGIEAADGATRQGIIRQLLKDRDLCLPREVESMLSLELPGDARQLAGALNRLEAVADAMKQPITVELARQQLNDLLRATQRVVRLSDIDRAVCDVFGLEPKSLQSARKAKAIAHPRMLAMSLARKYTRAALTEIGDYFGHRAHSTVISADKKVRQWIGTGTPIDLAHGQCSVEDAVRRVESRLRTG